MGLKRIVLLSYFTCLVCLIQSSSCSLLNERYESPAVQNQHGHTTFNQRLATHQQQPHQTSRGSIVMPPNNNNQLNGPYNPHHPFNARIQQTTSHLQADANSPTSSGGFLSGGNLELALRQSAGDESVFQPSPAMGAPGHNLDWFSQPSPSVSSGGSISLASQRLSVLDVVDSNHPVTAATSSQPATPPTTLAQQTTTTSSPAITINTWTSPQTPTQVATEQHYSNSNSNSSNSSNNNNNNNNIIQDDSVGHYDKHQGDRRQHEQDQHQQYGYQKEYQTNMNSQELNNQVVYEGPATASPAIGDYFFSSSEKLPNVNERPSNAWWAIGIGREYEKATNLSRDDYLSYCEQSQLLVSNKQRSLCRLHPKVMAIVARGLKLAIDECQSRFASNRWNCSVLVENSIAQSSSQPMPSNQSAAHTNPEIFGGFMQHPNRERSYLNAIIAAGLAHAMTKACSGGELPEECSCDKKIRSKSNKGRVEWVACSDDIDYGARFSRDFADNYESESDATSTIYIHNNEVGRRVFKSATDITCTCLNGDNGLCQTKRCWKHLGLFTDVGDELLKRYEGATHVQRSNRDPHKLRPVRRGVRRPKRKDLVYIDESPDYCQSDTRIGVLGTQNRRCNSTSSGTDSCSLLCCGRGYQEVVEEIEEDCNCKFVWCCQVKCDRCKRRMTSDVCN